MSATEENDKNNTEAPANETSDVDATSETSTTVKPSSAVDKSFEETTTASMTSPVNGPSSYAAGLFASRMGKFK